MLNFLGVLFLLLFIPIVLKAYKKDRGENGSAKFFNFTVSVILLYVFASETKRELNWAIYGPQKLIEKIFVEVGILSPFVNGLSWLLNASLSFVMSVLIIQIALRKEKSRRIFFQLLPFYWILNSLETYRYIISKNDVVSRFEYLLPGILFLDALFVILIYVFYSRAFINKFFQFKEQA